MFKKTLIAVALAGLSANALASTIADNTTTKYTQEAAQSAELITTGSGTVTLAAEYKVDDLITFTYSQAMDDSTPINQAVTVVLSNGLGAPNDMTGTMTLGFLSKSADKKSLVYRVTSLVSSGTLPLKTQGALVATPVVKMKAADVRAASGATVTYSATLSNGVTALDGLTSEQKAANIIKLNNQFTVSTPVVDGDGKVVPNHESFNGVIDVAAGRKLFEGPNGADTLGMALTSTSSGNPANDATLSKVTYTVNGNFAFLDNDAKAAGIQLKNLADVAVNGGASIKSVAADKIVIEHNAAAPLILTVTNKVGAVLPAQKFTLDAKVDYVDLGKNLVKDADDVAQFTPTTGLNAGAWTLNGASVDVPYLPYGTDVEQFLWVTNKGAQSGDVIVTAFDQAGKAYGPFTLATSAKGLVKLDAALKTELVKAGLSMAANPRIALNVTVNAPAEDISVYAAYKVTSANDRLSVPTVDLNKDKD